MGSFSRENSIKMFIKLYGDKLESYFTPLLLHKKVNQLTDVEASYYVSGIVEINGGFYKIHHRWSSETEEAEGVELEEDFVKLEDYYKKCIHQKTIAKIAVVIQDRDDEVYLTCCTEEGNDIQIPLGFDPERDEFSGFAEDLLSEEERNAYGFIRELDNIVQRWNHHPSSNSLESQATYVGEVVSILFENKKEFDPGYTVSDFDKMSKLWQQLNQEYIEPLAFLKEAKNVINL